MALAEVRGDAGGRIRVRGPLGVSRSARTSIASARPPADGAAGTIEGRAEAGNGTEARVEWRIERLGDGRSRVALEARFVRASLLDRLLLALGGRRWLARGFRRTLAGLDRLLASS